jgi:putative oxidoreductase
MRSLCVAGRVLYSLIFIGSGLNHFSQGTVAYAASFGVPWFLTYLAGVMALAGGLSVALGYRAREGAGLLVLFLVPVTFVMHKFWGLGDPGLAMNQYAHFMKNLSMLGGAFMVMYFGSGPYSLDNRKIARVERRHVRKPEAVGL